MTEESYKKGLRGTVSLLAQVALEDEVAKPTILTARTTADVVDGVKEQMLCTIKNHAMTLTIDDIKLEEINIPFLVTLK